MNPSESASSGDLTPEQMDAASHLSVGVKVVVVAKKLGVNRSTVHRWMEIPAFRGEVRRLTLMHAARVHAMFLRRVEKALDTLDEVHMDRNVNPMARVIAASKIADIAAKVAMQLIEVAEAEKASGAGKDNPLDIAQSIRDAVKSMGASVGAPKLCQTE